MSGSPGSARTLPFPATVPAAAMNFTFQKASPTAVVVRIGKALDFRNAAEFKAACQEHARQGVRYYVLDFSTTGILDSTGLGVIFSLYRQLTPAGGQVVFASVSRPVQVVVQLTRTYKVFRQFPTVEAALEAGSAPAGPAQIGSGEPLPQRPTGTL